MRMPELPLGNAWFRVSLASPEPPTGIWNLRCHEARRGGSMLRCRASRCGGVVRHNRLPKVSQTPKAKIRCRPGKTNTAARLDPSRRRDDEFESTVAHGCSPGNDRARPG